MRAKPSTNPPAANGTMTLIGCSGNSARAAGAAASAINHRFRIRSSPLTVLRGL
jgi:hypothetical protein